MRRIKMNKLRVFVLGLVLAATPVFASHGSGPAGGGHGKISMSRETATPGHEGIDPL
jgi:hypothetical protein